jgi:hypothetical protein
MVARLLALLFASAVLAVLPAAAESKLGESCELDDQVKDGFIALRDGPSPQAKLIGKMDPKGAVIPRTDRRGWRRGGWILVSYWRPGIEFDEALKSGPVGWMNEKLHTGCG